MNKKKNLKNLKSDTEKIWQMNKNKNKEIIKKNTEKT